MAENYRHVSLTSIRCKIVEHVILSNIIDHLENSEILNNVQNSLDREKKLWDTDLHHNKWFSDVKRMPEAIMLDFS